MLELYRKIFIIFCFFTIFQNADLQKVEKNDTDTEYSLNVDLLETLATIDMKIVKILTDHRENFQNHSKFDKLINKYTQDALESYPGPESLVDLNFDDKSKEISQNPIAVYSLLHRLGKKLPPILQKLQKIDQSIFDELDKFLSDLPEKRLPSAEDISRVKSAILTLQHIYGIPTTEMAVGIFPAQGIQLPDHNASDKINTGARLSSKLCFDLGRMALEQKKFPAAITWLHHAILLKSRQKNHQNSEFYKTIEKELRRAIVFHNIYFGDNINFGETELFPVVLEFREPLLENFGGALEHALSERRSARKIEQEKRWTYFRANRHEMAKDVNGNQEFLAQISNDICAGQNLQSELEKSRLFCWYERRRSPYYAMGPMKMEFISRDPDIVQVYEVIGPKAIENLENFQKGQFRRGAIIEAESFKTTISNIKIAADAPIFDWTEIGWDSMFVHGQHLFDFSREIHRLAKYSITGRFLPHIDSFGENSAFGIEQERIASYLVYISDVKVGGFTSLPLLGVGARPVKGSALLFYNVWASGDQDTMSHHAGCPILLGYKYYMVHFVLYNSEQKYSCHLQRGQRWRIKVNGQLPS